MAERRACCSSMRRTRAPAAARCRSRWQNGDGSRSVGAHADGNLHRAIMASVASRGVRAACEMASRRAQPKARMAAGMVCHTSRCRGCEGRAAEPHYRRVTVRNVKLGQGQGAAWEHLSQSFHTRLVCIQPRAHGAAHARVARQLRERPDSRWCAHKRAPPPATLHTRTHISSRAVEPQWVLYSPVFRSSGVVACCAALRAAVPLSPPLPSRVSVWLCACRRVACVRRSPLPPLVTGYTLIREPRLRVECPRYCARTNRY